MRRASLLFVALFACTPSRAPVASDDEHEGGGAAVASGEHVERVPTRAGVEMPVLVTTPERAPTGVVVMFPGGNGALGLTSSGIAHGADNFMVRTRGRFAADGFVAVVVDVPSDHADGIGAYRVSAEEAEDVEKLVAWTSARWPLAVWLVGTSRGTLSAANAVARGARVHGLVLTSSVTAGPKERLRDVAVDRIDVPTFVVHHDHDGCNASPLEGARKLEAALVRAPSKAFRTFDGGSAPRTAACGPLSYHGFYGLDADVVGAVSTFIRAH
jgi:hypothetical protein